MTSITSAPRGSPSKEEHMAPTAIDATTESTHVADLELEDEDELLVEEISIDGMCGVY